MKISISFFITFFLIINLSLAQKVSLDEAYQTLIKNDSFITTQKNVYYSIKKLPPKEKIVGFQTIESPNFESWFFFVDEKPYQSWEHSCYYAFVNTQTGDLQIIKSNLPPKLANMKIKILQPTSVPGKLFDFKKDRIELKSTTTYDATNDYAVIISGGYDDENNWFRYWNDCAAIYSALIEIYDYSPSHIYVIMSDGTSSGQDRVLSLTYDQQGNPIYIRDSSPLDLDGNGTNDIQYSATKSNISTVFNNLSNILDSDDHLFVFTTDHGGQESGSDVYLYLWGETMKDDEFATELDKVNPDKITVTMEQCHSGGFIDDISDIGRVISTSCTASETSFAMNNLTYNEYVYYWISAIAGETPEGVAVDADNNNDGWVSIREAFEYAENEDTQNETPQYNSMPENLGCFLRLSENWNWNLSGPSIVCSTGTSFTINDIPIVDSIIWECDSYLMISSGQNTSTCTFSAIGNGNSWVSVRLVNDCGDIILPQKTVWAGTETPNYIIAYDPILHTYPTEPLYTGTSYQFKAGLFNPSEDPSDYEWGVQRDEYIWLIPPGATNYFDFSTATPGNYTISLTFNNGCGWGDEESRVFWFEEPSRLVIAPNPSNGETTVSIETASADKSLDESVEWSLEVFDQAQLLKAQKTKIMTKTYNLNTSDWREGIYIVRAKVKDTILTEKLVVKK